MIAIVIIQRETVRKTVITKSIQVKKENQTSRSNAFVFSLSIFIELLELETALNDIEKSMDKIESQNSTIQIKLRDLLESNRQMAKEFTDIRRNMATKLKDVTHDLEQTSGTAQDLAAVTANTLNKIEHEMSGKHDHKHSK